MSTLETHVAEQAAITEACEAGTCDHETCKMDDITRAIELMEEDAAQRDPKNHHRAARILVTIHPAYGGETTKAAISGAITDILHLCDLAGFDFAKIEKTARHHYQRELMAHGAAHDTTLSQAIERS